MRITKSILNFEIWIFFILFIPLIGSAEKSFFPKLYRSCLNFESCHSRESGNLKKNLQNSNPIGISPVFVHGTEKHTESQILLSKNSGELSSSQIKRLSEIQQHREDKKRKQAEREKLRTQKEIAKIQPKYENCKEVDLSSLASLEDEQEENTSSKTEAEFCFTCSVKGLFGFKEIESINQHLEQSILIWFEFCRFFFRFLLSRE